MVYRHLIINIYILFFSISVTFGLDFSKCQEYYTNTSKEFSGVMAIHIGNGLYIAYSSKEIQNDKLIKSSPLIGLYLFKDNKISNKFDIKNIRSDIKVVAINKDSITKGHIISKQTSIKNLAVFSSNIQENSIISDICYQIYGISAGENKFIDKKYIDMFLSNNNYNENLAKDITTKYSYIGIEVDDNLIVTKINPLIIANIKIGDKILAINNYAIKTKNEFFDKITTTPPNTDITITTNNGIFSIHTLLLNTQFDMKNTYLEAFGVMINENIITTNTMLNNNLQQGDKILKINRINIKNINDIDSAIDATLEDNLNILVLRKNFEFFINIKKPLNIDRRIK